MHKEHNKTFEQILHERYSPKWCEVRHNRMMRAASLLANRINTAYRFFKMLAWCYSMTRSWILLNDKRHSGTFPTPLPSANTYFD